MHELIPIKKPAKIESVNVVDGEVIIRAFRLLSYKPTQDEVVAAAHMLSRCREQNMDYRANWLSRRIQEWLCL